MGRMPRTVLLLTVFLTATLAAGPAPDHSTNAPAKRATATPSVGLPPASITASASADPILDVHGATADQEAEIRDEAAQLLAAGFLLPDLKVVYADDDVACAGHMGLFESGKRPWQVTICSDVGMVRIHELFHAWERANMTNSDRLAYMRLRGLDRWSGTDVPRQDRAVEDVATLLQEHYHDALPAADTDVGADHRAAVRYLQSLS